MNVRGLPLAERDGGFWWVMVIMLAVVAVVLFVLRRLRLF